MTALVVLLWCVYVSDCLVRQQRGHWTLRRGLRGRMRVFAGPDIQLLGERIGFAWTPVLPWRAAYWFAGADHSLKTARRRLDAINQHLRWLKVACGALFVWVMVLLPTLIVSGWLLPVLYRWIAIGAALWLLALIQFFRAHKRIRQTAPPFEMWLMMTLSPLSLMRAPLAISLPAAADLHPLAATSVLCDDTEFLRMARLWYFDLVADRPVVERIVAERGLAGRLLSGPDAWDDGLSQFCPRCHATYLDAATGCHDCHGITLKPLASVR
jgi:hypothetical protein